MSSTFELGDLPRAGGARIRVAAPPVHEGVERYELVEGTFSQPIAG
jgi:hypothetical protein